MGGKDEWVYLHWIMKKQPISARPIAPASYAGYQSGFGVMPGFHLWTLNTAIPGYAEGSTLSERTLLDLGYDLPSTAISRNVQVVRQAKKDSFNPWAK